MATTNTLVPIRTAQGTNLDSLIDISKFLAGQKGTQTVSGQTAPLEAILAQMMEPGNLQNMVANLFQQGVAQVPALTTQFAGATGTRTSNNTMLAQSLAALNQSIAQAIAQQVVAQQSAAAGAAGKLAETNRTSRTTQGPGSLMKAAIPTLVGTGLNKLGKIMGADKAPTDASVATPNFSEFQASAFEIPELGLVSQDLGAAGFPGIDAGAIDLSSLFDFGADGAGDAVNYDFGPVETFDDFYAGEDFSNLFLRDGGRIGRFNSYADGGQPRQQPQLRGRPNLGQRVSPMRTSALSFRTPMPTSRRRTVDQEVESPGQSTVSPTAGVPGVTPGVSPFGGMAPASLGLGALQAVSMMSAPVNVLMEALITRAIVHQVKSLLAGSNPPLMPPAISISEAGIAMPSAEVPGFAETFGIESGFESGFDTGEGFDAGGFGDSGDAGDDGSSGTSGGGVSGDSGGDASGVGDGSGYRDGGKALKKKGIVRGTGTSTSDSITAKVSVDEYILPADTVAALGKDLLDSIVASTHTPVAGGTRGA